MTMIRLKAAHRDEIMAHGQETYPHECCGFLLGEETDGVKEVREIRRAPNARDDSPQNRYLIPPEAWLEVDKESRGLGLQILGFYHSHPDVAARPSRYDREHAWPWYSYLIVSVRAGQAGDLLAWIVPDDDAPFAEEEMVIEL